MKSLLVTVLVVVLFSLKPLAVQAQTRTAYGEGAYGSGTYNGSLITEVVNTVINALQRSTTNPPVCGMLQPGINPPVIYAAVSKGSHAIQIFLSPPSEPFDHYVLQFGTESTNLKWGISSLPKDTGAYTIEFLSPNTTYHFQVRGGNGCATGNWSNILSAKTLGFYNSNRLITDSVSVTYKKTEEQTSQNDGNDSNTPDSSEASDEAQLTEEQTHTISITVLGANGKPLPGATVHIPDESTPAKTDGNGIALLEGITKGNKTIIIEYENYKGEQQIAVLGDNDTVEVKTTVHQEDTVLSPIFLIPVFGLLIAGMFYFFRKKKRKKTVKMNI